MIRTRNVDEFFIPFGTSGTAATAAVTPVIAPANTASTPLIGNKWVAAFPGKIVRVVFKVVAAVVTGGANTTWTANIQAKNGSTVMATVKIADRTLATILSPAAGTILVADAIPGSDTFAEGDIIDFTHTTGAGVNTNITTAATYVPIGVVVALNKGSISSLIPRY